MKGHPLSSAPKRRSPWAFFLLVTIMSAPFWLIDPLAEQLLPDGMPIDLPISSLAVLVPISAASILVQREDGWEGVKKLLQRSLDWRGVKGVAWYVPILLLMPAIMVLQYGTTHPMRVPIPDPQFSAWMVPVLLVVFFVAALGEEGGWQGYAVDPLIDRWNALTASIVLGIACAVWHIVPLIQLHRTPTWIAWQCMSMVATRILMVWLYSSTGKSVFAAVLYHTMYNVSTLLLPDLGLHYDPTAACIITAMIAAIVTFLWGPETLARYRYARARAAEARTGLPSSEV